MFKFVVYDKDHSRLRVNKNNISISTEFSGSKGQLIEYIKVVVERLFTFAIDNGVEEYLLNIITTEYRNRHPVEEKRTPEEIAKTYINEVYK